MVGDERWIQPSLVIKTVGTTSGKPRNYGKVYTDWEDMNVRDLVLDKLLHQLSENVVVESQTRTEVAHNRILEISFSSGDTLAVRFDEGLSYWRVSYGNRGGDIHFPFRSEPELQSQYVLDMQVRVEGKNYGSPLVIKTSKGSPIQ